VSIALHRITDTSPASAITAIGGDTIGGLSRYDGLAIYATLTGGTGGTLDVYLQTSFDGGTTWYDYVHFAQKASGAAVTTVGVGIPPAGVTALTATGKGSLLTPAVGLAVNTIIGGPWGDLMRAVYVAGVSTSAGAAQIIEIIGYQGKR
jgi:hypothetical protein